MMSIRTCIFSAACAVAAAAGALSIVNGGLVLAVKPKPGFMVIVR